MSPPSSSSTASATACLPLLLTAFFAAVVVVSGRRETRVLKVGGLFSSGPGSDSLSAAFQLGVSAAADDRFLLPVEHFAADVAVDGPNRGETLTLHNRSELPFFYFPTV